MTLTRCGHEPRRKVRRLITVAPCLFARLRPKRIGIWRKGFGISPRVIAKTLNEEGVSGPEGRLWNDTTIHGHAKRGTGLLNNELYIGRLIWNRLRYLKDPSTGKRVSRLNPEAEWIVKDVPELRIVDDELWQAVKARQAVTSAKYANVAEGIGIRKHHKKNRLNGTHRPKTLLSGLVFCGCCGGPFSIRGSDRFACSTHVTKVPVPTAAPSCAKTWSGAFSPA